MIGCPECRRLENEYLGEARVAIRDAYTAAYKRANETTKAPRLSYDRGWWQLWTLQGFRDRRVRQAVIIEWTATLNARADKRS